MTRGGTIFVTVAEFATAGFSLRLVLGIKPFIETGQALLPQPFMAHLAAAGISHSEVHPLHAIHRIFQIDT